MSYSCRSLNLYNESVGYPRVYNSRQYYGNRQNIFWTAIVLSLPKWSSLWWNVFFFCNLLDNSIKLCNGSYYFCITIEPLEVRVCVEGGGGWSLPLPIFNFNVAGSFFWVISLLRLVLTSPTIYRELPDKIIKLLFFLNKYLKKYM